MDRGRTDSFTHGPDRCGQRDCTGDQRRAVVASVIFMIASIAVPALVWVIRQAFRERSTSGTGWHSGREHTPG